MPGTGENQVDVGDKDAQDVFCQWADVHGYAFGNFFEQAVVITMVVGEQHRAVLTSAEHLLNHLPVFCLGAAVRPRQVGPKVDEDALPAAGDLGAAAADLVAAAVDGQVRHIIFPPFRVSRWQQSYLPAVGRTHHQGGPPAARAQTRTEKRSHSHSDGCKTDHNLNTIHKGDSRRASNRSASALFSTELRGPESHLDSVYTSQRNCDRMEASQKGRREKDGSILSQT